MNFHNVSTNFNVQPNQKSISAVFAAGVAVFFAYAIPINFDNHVGSERRTKEAAKSIIYSRNQSDSYVLVVVALMLLAPASSYGISGDPITHALGNSSAPTVLSYLIQIGALVATTSAALAMILTSSRILHQLSLDGMIPKNRSKI